MNYLLSLARWAQKLTNGVCWPRSRVFLFTSGNPWSFWPCLRTPFISIYNNRRVAHLVNAANFVQRVPSSHSHGSIQKGCISNGSYLSNNSPISTEPRLWEKEYPHTEVTNISHLRKRKNISKHALGWDMWFCRRVNHIRTRISQVSTLSPTWCRLPPHRPSQCARYSSPAATNNTSDHQCHGCHGHSIRDHLGCVKCTFQRL